MYDAAFAHSTVSESKRADIIAGAQQTSIEAAMLARAFALVLVTASALSAQQNANRPVTIAQATAGLTRQDGFFPIYFDERTGKLQMEVARLDQDFLYLNSLSTGLGSNDLGLDRGTIGDEAVVRFERHGARLFLVRRNLGFRATSGTPELARSEI